MLKYIIADIDIFSDESDKEEFNEENSDQENSDEENSDYENRIMILQQ